MSQSSSAAQADPEQASPFRLQRSLSLIETWGFGLTGLLLWMGVAPGAHHDLGAQAMWVWIPGALIGVVINLQVQQLGRGMPDVAGGTPNYITHLLKDYPKLTTYAAIGYFISWVAVLPVNAIILTDLVQANFAILGIALPETLLRVGFTVLAFIVAFSGSRALGTLHLVFLLPAVGFLLAFCLQGMYWVANSSPDLSLLQDDGSTFSFQGWAKWYLNGTYAFYACETASAFVADSKRPQGTLGSLLVAAGLIPLVYIGGSWLLMHLATNSALRDDTFLNLLTVAKPFWGQFASFLVTFLVVSSSLLSCATAVSICPRILYQLAQDNHLSPIFGVTSRQGVFAPGLILTLLLSLVCLLWENVHLIVMVTGVGWLVSFIVLHWGLWQQRENPNVLLPRWSLLLCGLEVVVLVVGGFAWGAQYLLIGLLLPGVILLGDRGIQHISWQVVKPEWWLQQFDQQKKRSFQDFIALQVLVLVLFISGAAIASWFVSSLLTRMIPSQHADLLVVLLLILSFVGVAIACWTVFPQIVAVNEAREEAERSSRELQATLQRLQQTQIQLVQQEKMSSLGQLVAGVAHEINNPVNFIHGNVEYADEYVHDLINLLHLYQKHYPSPAHEIQHQVEAINIEFVQEDLIKILTSMKVGTERIRQIVLSLRNFSRNNEAEAKATNIHDGIESTLLILQHRLKAKPNHPTIEVIRDYGELPLVECYPDQLNQVFMNILANAIEALEESFVIRHLSSAKTESFITNNQAQESLVTRHLSSVKADSFITNTQGQMSNAQGQMTSPTITIHTSVVGSDWVKVAIADNGTGIPEAVQLRIFDPFFTTKPVGKGTGLGMSISYQIITEKHNGKLECFSTPGTGTEFVIQLPIR
ncbi:MAG: ATP-binding protein [Leptolyngbyaceae cyanobacterium bins.302]|nr:ATP-binding protein [Leptolyngbyaceae cyanobacterium bins.302]